MKLGIVGLPNVGKSTLFNSLTKAGALAANYPFATRCIEGGMKPKTLQQILGHSNIGITMNLYVHITEDEKHREIDLVADALKVI